MSAADDAAEGERRALIRFDRARERRRRATNEAERRAADREILDTSQSVLFYRIVAQRDAAWEAEAAVAVRWFAVTRDELEPCPRLGLVRELASGVFELTHAGRVLSGQSPPAPPLKTWLGRLDRERERLGRVDLSPWPR